jgi:hypothetical protein
MEHAVTRTHLARRMDRIAAARHDRTIRNAAYAIAARLGVTPQEVMEEALRLLQEARRLGITAVEVVAHECGMSVADVWLDVAQQQVHVTTQGGG